MRSLYQKQDSGIKVACAPQILGCSTTEFWNRSMRPNWLAILQKWSRFYNNIIGCFNCLVLPAFPPAKCFLRLYIAPWFPSYLWFSTLVLATTCCDDSTPTGRLVLPPIDVPHLPAVPSACFFHACLVFSLLSVFILACCLMFPPAFQWLGDSMPRLAFPYLPVIPSALVFLHLPGICSTWCFHYLAFSLLVFPGDSLIPSPSCSSMLLFNLLHGFLN